MKSLLTFSMHAVCLFTQPAAAQWTPGTFMSQALKSCFDAADVFLKETNYGYEDTGITLVGTYMNAGEIYDLSKSFDAKQSYIIIAAGDEDATDVDLRIRDANGVTVVQDNATDRIAIVEFTPKNAGDFSIEVELYEAKQPSFVAFVILKDGGWTVPRDDLNLAWDRVARMCEGGNQGAERQGRYLRFNDGTRQAALFGGLIHGGDAMTLTNLNFGEGDIMICAAGDSDVEDIDLLLFDRSFNELTADRLPDANPVLSHTTSGQQSYHVELQNAGSSNSPPTFCIVGLLQVRN